jgi:hypothetical protein
MPVSTITSHSSAFQALSFQRATCSGVTRTGRTLPTQFRLSADEAEIVTGDEISIEAGLVIENNTVGH